MQEQLAAVAAELARMQERLHRLVDRLPEERWARRNDPARWSAAECVAHLDLTAEAYLPLLHRALEEARALGRPAPRRYRRDAMGVLIGLAAGPLPSIRGRTFLRARTPAAFVPNGDLVRAATVAEFDRLQREQLAIVERAEGLPIDAVTLVSPFGPVSYSAWSALRILPRHQRRHLIQAEGVWPA